MKYIFLFSILMALLTVGCQTKTGTGALAGGALGAGTGALIGGGQGALIGGAVGAVAGGLVGAALDEQDRENMQRQCPSTLRKVDQGNNLSVSDVIAMSHCGIKDDTIIDQIASTHTVFNLSPNDFIALRNANVSERVISYMASTGRSAINLNIIYNSYIRLCA